jgi:hypothetical protein
MWVEGVFEYDGLPLTITRGKKLKIDLNGEITTGSAKISEERLDQILAIPRDLFRPMLHKEQGEKGFFLNFTPKETNDFLIDCLGLNSFKKPLLELDVKLQELIKKRDDLTVSLGSNTVGLVATQDALKSLGEPPKQEIDRQAILCLKEKMEASNAEYKRISEFQKEELAKFEALRPVPEIVPFDTSRRKHYEEELNGIKTQINQLHLTNKDKENAFQIALSGLKAEQVQLQQQVDLGIRSMGRAQTFAAKIKKIRENICPTCEQTWNADSAKIEEAQYLKEIGDLRALVLKGEQANALLTVSKEKLEKLMDTQPPAVPDGLKELWAKEKELKTTIERMAEAERKHNTEQNEQYKHQLGTFGIRLSNVKEKHAIDIATIGQQAVLDQRVFDGAVSKLRSFDEARKRYDTTFGSLMAQEHKYMAEMDIISKQIATVKHDIESYEELKRAVKSYLSCSFDEALETISENATRLVRCVPNMANATIKLMGLWETKEGKIKEEVNAVLSLDGDENIDIRSLCGGERSAIDLAVDLSVIELIENKTNKGINIFVLDEPFTGLDTVCIEMALEVLKNSSTNKKLIIVDHNPEVKEMVESRLLVVRDGLTSKVIQN